MITTDLSSTDNALQQIQELKRAKQFATEFPRLRHLLNQLTTNEGIARAGQLLKNINCSEIVTRHPDVKSIKIALTGNFVLQPIKPLLAYFHLRENILIDTHFTDYGQYTYELINSNSELYDYRPDITVCLLDEHIIFDELSAPWRLTDIERALQEKTQHIERLITKYVNTSQGLLILNTVPLPVNRINQLLDYKSKALLGYFWKEFNARILKLSSQFKSLIVIDLDPLLADATGLSDDRFSQYAKMHMTESLLCNYAREISFISRALAGQSKKCLVLDLDNTLWKGILGDDGIEGIEVAETLAGEAYHHFQRTIKQLADQGVLLAISSKNDQDNVIKVLQNHPQMVLREEDFVKICVNWSPKHENVQAIAQSLNLNPDSFVFVDDSEFERNLVRSKLPSVTVVDVEDDPATFTSGLLAGGWFNTLEITKEDYSRSLKYRTEVERQDFLSKFDSIGDYLRELQIKVRLFTPQQADIARISQLTLRTNQFNVTTKRYQEAEISHMLTDPLTTIVGIHAQDRFGDNGIVGCVIAHQPANNKNELHIDNFLLSCRVFSRGIETISLEHVLQQAKKAGINRVYAEYYPTAKNQKVRDFYKQQGFEVVEETEKSVFYERFLDDIDLSVKHIELHANYGGF
jgi:FkbH-like protein